MVNPGGTGTPRFVISARFAPLPPSTRFISRVPSARPFPKKYTRRVTRSSSAAASKAQLVGIRRGRRRVIAREARVAETFRSTRYSRQHSLERQVAQRVDPNVLRDLGDFHVGGDQLLARRRVDAVVARA